MQNHGRPRHRDQQAVREGGGSEGVSRNSSLGWSPPVLPGPDCDPIIAFWRILGSCPGRERTRQRVFSIGFPGWRRLSSPRLLPK